MKISDIPADRAFDVLADVAGPLSNIVSDSEAMSSISAASATDAVRAVGEIARTHKDDLNAILAAVGKELSLAELQACAKRILTLALQCRKQRG